MREQISRLHREARARFLLREARVDNRDGLNHRRVGLCAAGAFEV